MPAARFNRKTFKPPKRTPGKRKIVKGKSPRFNVTGTPTKTSGGKRIGSRRTSGRKGVARRRRK